MNINYTIIGQTITFFIFVAFVFKYVWPPIMQAMKERSEKIANGLEAADRAERDLELAKEEAGKKLRAAKQEAQTIIDSANKRANQILDEAKENALAEGARLKAAAAAEVEQEVNRAREELRAQVATLVMQGAEAVLGSSIDAKAHNELVNKLAGEL
ncbi:MAG: F0F1 ATP synthase subunit B [Pseudomonadales bacterium]|uniref:ATP synthase subunit b n=1 Tax=Umboniibacter marinipuniceus TaxID=569599 RepID=A0A3M0AH80_9GAMM|nr:F0F1 ATP synthase subunit B [Umboniibacter marinipuniceus]RMA82118.1 ATP synthase F0 subcomplex B subunit [Umboniibacter marinipuniceus]